MTAILGKVRDFLKLTKQEFTNADSDLSNCVLVFGNESTGKFLMSFPRAHLLDLDSIVSAVLVAESLRILYKVKAFPVLNTFRPETVRLRGEVTCTLGEDSHLLMITLTDVLMKAIFGGVQVFLVDHNEPSLQWPATFVDRVTVVGIIDHHFDGGKFKDTCKYGRVIEECGSNTSLVVREVFSHPENESLDKDFMKIALYPIIFDTKHYRFRAIDLDFKATRMLLNLLSEDEDHVRDQTAAIWKNILESELDELDVPLGDLLYKDYKQYRLDCKTGPYLLGMSTIRSSFEGHMQRSNRTFPQMVDQVLLPFFDSERLDGMLLIFSYQDPLTHKFMQEFVMVLPGLDINHLIGFFSRAGMEFTTTRAVLPSTSTNSAYAATTNHESSKATVTWIPQENRLYNRKKIQPLLQEYLTTHI